MGAFILSHDHLLACLTFACDQLIDNWVNTLHGSAQMMAETRFHAVVQIIKIALFHYAPSLNGGGFLLRCRPSSSEPIPAWKYIFIARASVSFLIKRG